MKNNEPKIWPETKQYDGWLFFVFAFVRCISLVTMHPWNLMRLHGSGSLSFEKLYDPPGFPTTTEIKPWYDPRKTIVEWFSRRKKPWVLRIGRAIFVTTTFVGILEPFFPQRYFKKTCKDHIRICLPCEPFLQGNQLAKQTNKQTNKQTTLLPQLPPPPSFPNPCPAWGRALAVLVVRGTVRFFRLSASESPPESDGEMSQNHQLGAYLTHHHQWGYTLEDERLEPTAITHEKKGKWSEPNLQGIMFRPIIFRGVFAPLWVELVHPTYNFYTPEPKHQQIEKENHLNQTSGTLGLYVDFPGYTQYYTLGNQVPVYRFSSKWSLSPLQSSECKLLNQNNDEFVHWLMISIRWSFFRWRNLSHVYLYIYIWSWFLLLAWKKLWSFLCCLLGDVRNKETS